jgi:hypothetical protein
LAGKKKDLARGGVEGLVVKAGKRGAEINAETHHDRIVEEIDRIRNTHIGSSARENSCEPPRNERAGGDKKKEDNIEMWRGCEV